MRRETPTIRHYRPLVVKRSNTFNLPSETARHQKEQKKKQNGITTYR